MTCEACKQPNSPERNYCGACGARLVHHCPGCGFRNLRTDRFCGGCGSGLGAVSEHASAVARAPSNEAHVPTHGRSELQELLEAASEQAGPEPEESSVRVNQLDIDQLFGE